MGHIDHNTSFKVVVANAGGLAAHNIRVGIYIDGDYLGEYTLRELAAVNGEGANAEATLVEITITNPGTYTFGFRANHTRSITESNYNNNYAERTYTVNAPPPTGKVDIAAYDIVCTPEPIQQRYKTGFQVIIANFGDSTAYNIPTQVQFYGSKSGYLGAYSFTASDIKPNQARGYVISTFFYRYEEITVNLIVSAPNDVNPTNNQKSKVFQTALYQPTDPEDAGWAWPAEGLKKISGFWRKYSLTNSSPHAGIDIVSIQFGQTHLQYQRAVEDGVVYRTGYGELTGNFIMYKVNQLHYETGKQPIIIYMHLESKPDFQNNAEINKGDVLGKTGQTGCKPADPNKTNYHMHFEIRKYGEYGDLWGFTDFDIVNYTDNPLAYFPDENLQYSVNPPNLNNRTSNVAMPELDYPMFIYIVDGFLLEKVGYENAIAWFNSYNNTEHVPTIFDFLDNFNITEQEYISIMEKEGYLEDAIQVLSYR